MHSIHNQRIRSFIQSITMQGQIHTIAQRVCERESQYIFVVVIQSNGNELIRLWSMSIRDLALFSCDIGQLNGNIHSGVVSSCCGCVFQTKTVYRNLFNHLMNASKPKSMTLFNAYLNCSNGILILCNRIINVKTIFK